MLKKWSLAFFFLFLLAFIFHATSFAYVDKNEPFIIFGELSPQVGKLGKNWKEPHTGMEFVWIPEGKFMMGSPDTEKNREEDEGPVHEVELSGFYIGKYEVTNKQYHRYNEKHYIGDSLDGDNQPVTNIFWEDAKSYSEWMNMNHHVKGMVFDLPSEAQWEYACRAGTSTPFYWGENISIDQANFDGEKIYLGFLKIGKRNHTTKPVGSYSPNAFGIYDMHGNVSEYCIDAFSLDFYKSPSAKIVDPINPFKYGSESS